MNLSMSMSLRQALECRVCQELLPEEEDKDFKFEVFMFGAAAYAVCPCCHGNTVDIMHDQNFRRRMRRYIKSLRKKEEK